MNRHQKEEFVSSLQGHLASASLVVVARQSGLSVAESTDLRNQMRSAGAEFKVIKNTLARIAVKDTKFSSIIDLLSGPTSIAYSEDPVAAAKVAINFSEKNEKLQVVGGALGEKMLTDQQVKALAKLPSLDEMRAKLMGTIQAPARQLASVVQAPARQLVQVVSAYAKK